MYPTVTNGAVTWEEVQRARERLSGVAFHTPVMRSRRYDERMGCYSFFKPENLQRSGSIRFRGVFNRIKAHVEREHATAVVAYSSGNHGQAVALTAKVLGLKTLLLLPKTAGPAKVAAARDYGASVEFFDPQTDNPQEIAVQLCLNTGALLVPPTPDSIAIAGYATAVIEFLEEIHDLQALILPFAADDLLSGCTMVAKQMIPNISVYGAEMARPASGDVAIPNLDVWNLIEGVLSATEEQVIETQIFILERMKLLVERSGVVAAAAIRSREELFAGKRTGILLSSGNVDFHKLSLVLSRHKYMHTLRGTEDATPQVYRATCFTCREPFDAVQAVFCNCLTNDRTLVCPRCLNCFCRANSAYKDRFWQNAPQALWDREAEEHRRNSSVHPNIEPFEVARPLVLLVDDDNRTRQMAAKVISELGYGVVSASNGEAGLIMARKYVPEMILTDALMPRLDGREMCRRLKEDPATAGIKVIISTALYTQSKYRTEAFRQFHVDEYLSKPLSFNELRSLLQKYLG